MKKTNNKKKTVTLQDVADVAGVSVMTVSNVIRGSVNAVGEETRKRVEREIVRLNYRPNFNARSLRASTSQSIALVISDTDPAFLSDPFISQLVSGLSNYLSSVDYSLDIQGIAPEEFEKANILRKVGNDAMCAILCGSESLRKKHIDYLRVINQPTVIFQEPISCRGYDIAVIRQDDLGGGQALGEHLAAKGVERVAFLRPSLTWAAIEQREKGLRSSLASNKRKIDCRTSVSDSESFHHSKEAADKLLRNECPDAIVAVTDSMAIAAMHVCAELGLSVPGDIKVAGFNGFDAWQYAIPTLTTVKSPAYDMGQRAGKLILQRLDRDKFPRKSIVFPTELIPGDST